MKAAIVNKKPSAQQGLMFQHAATLPAGVQPIRP